MRGFQARRVIITYVYIHAMTQGSNCINCAYVPDKDKFSTTQPNSKLNLMNHYNLNS